MRLHPQLKHLHSRLWEMRRSQKPVALATLIDTYGSTPQVPGASALFGTQGLIQGTLGGGILEKDAESRAAESLKTGLSQLYTFALEADLDSEHGAICGGGVRMLIDAQPFAHAAAFEALLKSQKDRRTGILVTQIEEQRQQGLHLNRLWVPAEDAEQGIPGDALVREHIKACLRSQKPVLYARGIPTSESEPPSDLVFLEPFFPLPRLVIAGAGHIGQAVAHLGHLLEFEVTVIDDRPEYANPDNLPDADRILVKDIGPALEDIPLGPDTYLVIVTRGHRHDGEALRSSITSDAAYIGMIGSRSKIALMREQFLDQSWANPALWDRVHAPIGLDIHSQTVEEIAVSIAAQLVQERHRVGKEPGDT